MSADAESRSEHAVEPPPEPTSAVASEDQGGDAACWLGRVCDNCGALIEGSRGVLCWRCDTPWQPA